MITRQKKLKMGLNKGTTNSVLKTSYLCAVKFIHHNWFSVREKFDAC